MNWEELREELKFDTEKEMFSELYETYGSLGKLAESFGVSTWTVRRKLNEHGIPIKQRGGANYVKLLDFDDELFHRIEAEGLTNVAKALGVANYTLILRRKRYLREKEEAEAVEQPTQSSTQPD